MMRTLDRSKEFSDMYINKLNVWKSTTKDYWLLIIDCKIKWKWKYIDWMKSWWSFAIMNLVFWLIYTCYYYIILIIVNRVFLIRFLNTFS